jgi:hypothetical protein
MNGFERGRYKERLERPNIGSILLQLLIFVNYKIMENELKTQRCMFITKNILLLARKMCIYLNKWHNLYSFVYL